MLRTNVIGIDLAKNVLQVCHISRQGELLSNKAVSRQKLKELLAKSKPSLVALRSGPQFLDMTLSGRSVLIVPNNTGTDYD
ncbi:hypothetical protein BOO35_19405 [Vibrio navarrensis]|nr:hypothetical protein [Vibrio navarrensis]